MLSALKLNQIYSRLSRLNTARGSGTGLVTVGPAKVKACKSILCTQGIPEVEIKDCDQNDDRMSENDEKLPYLQ